MQQTLYPIEYNEKHYTVMANDLIRGKQAMTLQEARILRLLITQVLKDDDDYKTFTCDIKELASFLDIDSSNLYRTIYDIITSLSQQVVKIGSGNPKQPWEIFSWISLAKYDGAGTITLRLSDQIKPYILELREYYTQYRLENILSLKSFYAIRLYELFKSEFFKDDVQYIEYSVDFLREFFDCEDKYKKYNDFKKRVLEIAVREINEKTDIKVFEVIEIKKSRKIEKLKFILVENIKKL